MNRVCCLALCFSSLTSAVAEEPKTPRTDLYGDPLPPGAVARLGTMRLRHAYADATFSADGKQLISCGGDREVRVWDVASGALRRRRRLAGMALAPRDYPVVLSPGGATAAFADQQRVYLFDTNTGKERGRLPAGYFGSDLLLAFSGDGKVLAVHGREGNRRLNVQLWDVAGFKKNQTLKDSSEISRVAFSPDGKRIVGIKWRNDSLYLWDAATGDLLRKTNSGDRIFAHSAAFSSDGKRIAVGSVDDCEVRLLDAKTLKKEAVLQPPKEEKGHALKALLFSPHGRWLVGADYFRDVDYPPHGVLLWDLTDKEKARRLEPEVLGMRMAFAPDGKTLACFDETKSTIRLWDTALGRQRPLQHPGHETRVRVLALSADGRTMASGEPQDTMRLWDVATGKQQRALTDVNISIRRCIFTPDGASILLSGYYESIQVWNVATGKKQRQFAIERFPAYNVTLDSANLSADGKRVAAIVSGGKEPRSTDLFVWNAATGKLLLRRPYTLEKRVRSEGGITRIESTAHAAFSPDGESMSVWLGDRVGLEEIATKTRGPMLPKGLGAPLMFSPDGRLLVASVWRAKVNRDEGIGLSILETASGAEVVRLETESLLHFAFTPDGRAFIVASKKKLAIFDSATGERLYQMAWPESVLDGSGKPALHSLIGLPGGRAATGMEEGDILLWDLRPSTWPVPKPASAPSRKALDAYWSDLAGDAPKAYRALSELVEMPAATVPDLNARLQPVTVDGKRVEKLLADLDSDLFSSRETASRELARLRFHAEPLLRQALEGKPSLEMRRRLKSILAEAKLPPVEALRTLRAIAVLERIGTPEAQRILEKLAGGADAPETREARAALERLKRRDTSANGRSSP